MIGSQASQASPDLHFYTRRNNSLSASGPGNSSQKQPVLPFTVQDCRGSAPVSETLAGKIKSAIRSSMPSLSGARFNLTRVGSVALYAIGKTGNAIVSCTNDYIAKPIDKRLDNAFTISLPEPENLEEELKVLIGEFRDDKIRVDSHDIEGKKPLRTVKLDKKGIEDFTRLQQTRNDGAFLKQDMKVLGFSEEVQEGMERGWRNEGKKSVQRTLLVNSLNAAAAFGALWFSADKATSRTMMYFGLQLFIVGMGPMLNAFATSKVVPSQDLTEFGVSNRDPELKAANIEDIRERIETAHQEFLDALDVYKANKKKHLSDPQNTKYEKNYATSFKDLKKKTEVFEQVKDEYKTFLSIFNIQVRGNERTAILKSAKAYALLIGGVAAYVSKNARISYYTQLFGTIAQVLLSWQWAGPGDYAARHKQTFLATAKVTELDATNPEMNEARLRNQIRTTAEVALNMVVSYLVFQKKLAKQDLKKLDSLLPTGAILSSANATKSGELTKRIEIIDNDIKRIKALKDPDKKTGELDQSDQWTNLSTEAKSLLYYALMAGLREESRPDLSKKDMATRIKTTAAALTERRSKPMSPKQQIARLGATARIGDSAEIMTQARQGWNSQMQFVVAGPGPQSAVSAGLAVFASYKSLHDPDFHMPPLVKMLFWSLTGLAMGGGMWSARQAMPVLDGEKPSRWRLMNILAGAQSGAATAVLAQDKIDFRKIMRGMGDLPVGWKTFFNLTSMKTIDPKNGWMLLASKALAMYDVNSIIGANKQALEWWSDELQSLKTDGRLMSLIAEDNEPAAEGDKKPNSASSSSSTSGNPEAGKGSDERSESRANEGNGSHPNSNVLPQYPAGGENSVRREKSRYRSGTDAAIPWPNYEFPESEDGLDAINLEAFTASARVSIAAFESFKKVLEVNDESAETLSYISRQTFDDAMLDATESGMEEAFNCAEGAFSLLQKNWGDVMRQYSGARDPISTQLTDINKNLQSECQTIKDMTIDREREFNEKNLTSSSSAQETSVVGTALAAQELRITENDSDKSLGAHADSTSAQVNEDNQDDVEKLDSTQLKPNSYYRRQPEGTNECLWYALRHAICAYVSHTGAIEEKDLHDLQANFDSGVFKNVWDKSLAEKGITQIEDGVDIDHVPYYLRHLSNADISNNAQGLFAALPKEFYEINIEAESTQDLCAQLETLVPALNAQRACAIVYFGLTPTEELVKEPRKDMGHYVTLVWHGAADGTPEVHLLDSRRAGPEKVDVAAYLEDQITARKMSRLTMLIPQDKDENKRTLEDMDPLGAYALNAEVTSDVKVNSFITLLKRVCPGTEKNPQMAVLQYIRENKLPSNAIGESEWKNFLLGRKADAKASEGATFMEEPGQTGQIPFERLGEWLMTNSVTRAVMQTTTQPYFYLIEKVGNEYMVTGPGEENQWPYSCLLRSDDNSQQKIAGTTEVHVLSVSGSDPNAGFAKYIGNAKDRVAKIAPDIGGSADQPTTGKTKTEKTGLLTSASASPLDGGEENKDLEEVVEISYEITFPPVKTDKPGDRIDIFSDKNKIAVMSEAEAGVSEPLSMSPPSYPDINNTDSKGDQNDGQRLESAYHIGTTEDHVLSVDGSDPDAEFARYSSDAADETKVQETGLPMSTSVSSLDGGVKVEDLEENNDGTAVTTEPEEGISRSFSTPPRYVTFQNTDSKSDQKDGQRARVC